MDGGGWDNFDETFENIIGKWCALEIKEGC
jgi:hypothetical protein